MIMKEPEVLKSKYVSMDENGVYVLDKDAPPNIVQQFEEYNNSITADGTVSADPVPSVPPRNK